MKKLSLKAKLYLALAGIAIVLIATFSLSASLSSDAQRLKYSYDEEKDAYVVLDIKNTYRSGWFAHKEITIPSVHRGKKVVSVHLISSPYIEKVTISEGITSLEYSAFNADSSLKEVVLPSTLTFIDGCCFQNCVNLDTINLKDTKVTTLPLKVFQNCKNLVFSEDDLSKITSFGEYCLSNTAITSFKFKEGVTNVPNYMFENCSKLTSVSIPNSVTSIGEGSFNNTPNLSLEALPTSLTSIGGLAFQGSKFTEITIPTGVTEIGKNAFCDSSNLTTVSFNNKIETIGDKAFYNCTNLANINLPTTVKSIGSNAFRSTKITEVNLSNASFVSNSFNDNCAINVDLSDAANVTIEGNKLATFTILKSQVAKPVYDLFTDVSYEIKNSSGVTVDKLSKGDTFTVTLTYTLKTDTKNIHLSNIPTTITIVVGD